jgi:type IV pilus assembly protein PilC
MAVTKNAARTAAKQPAAVRRADAMPIFVWEGNDKRGVKMKGESAARNANLVRAELRKQGITPTVVKV